MSKRAEEIASRARRAQRIMGGCSAKARTEALGRAAARIRERSAEILEANRADKAEGEASGLSSALLQRLGLSESKLESLCDGLEQLAAWPDPIGEVLKHTEMAEGLDLKQVRAPLGVLLVIFESRPEAVVQIGGLVIRSGNAVILKGGAEAERSNAILVEILRQALEDAALPVDTVASVVGREQAQALLACDKDIDLVIPRGSGELVRAIQQSTRIPVLGHAEGICHLYLDADASLPMATRLAVDGKCDYPAACNATETLLVHQRFLPKLAPVLEALAAKGVYFVADERAHELVPGARRATEETWRTEYGELGLSVRVVESLEAAVEHIHRYGSGHTESICTADPAAAEQFLRLVDSAAVFHNASTRFSDGYRFGLGAEVGISTGRIHARGPVGIEGLMTTRWLLQGHGECVEDFSSGKLSYTHRKLS